MQTLALHDWKVTPAEARQIQAALRHRVSRRAPRGDFRTVAGVDISIRQNRARAAIPVFRYHDLQLIELVLAERPVEFPYVPGLLSFREIPVILAAVEKLSVAPDLVLVDGQGIAHPRRFGLAAHLGVLLDRPTIGCAKTRLCGAHGEPGEEAGSVVRLCDEKRPSEVIGAVVRTRTRVKPMYISVGHQIDLRKAVRTVLTCCRGYRLPEPTRQAHLAAGGGRRSLTAIPASAPPCLRPDWSS